MNIATALNKKYLFYTVVMLTSLCENNKEHIDAYVLHSELEDNDFETMRSALNKYDICMISLKVDRDRFDWRLPRNTQWSIEAYFRLMLVDLLPETVERLLYLDVDLIINQSIEEFYHVSFEGDEIISCDDSCGQRNWESLSAKQQEMLGPMLKQGYRYFNSGVMLMNIQEMRGKYGFDTYWKAIRDWNFQMAAPDQDILNYVHWKKVGYVDYNEFDLFARIAHNQNRTYADVKKNARIIHYAGDKPWDVTNCHFDIEQLWWDYAKRTPFYHQLLEDFTYRTMMDEGMEQTMRMLINENGSLKEKVRELMEIIDKIMKTMGKYT